MYLKLDCLSHYISPLLPGQDSRKVRGKSQHLLTQVLSLTKFLFFYQLGAFTFEKNSTRKGRISHLFRLIFLSVKTLSYSMSYKDGGPKLTLMI